MELEESETGREVLQQLILNAEAAKEQRIPFCQDTGYAVVCVEFGQNVHIEACATHIASFPAIVVNDLHGRDLYEEGPNLYRRLRAG